MLGGSRRFWVSLSILAAQGCATAPAADAPPPPQAAARTVVHEDASAPTDSAPASGDAPQDATPKPGVAWSAFPLATNCQAKLALTEEVSRLLTRAAAHSTHSRACVDGPGSRFAATDILVCPAAPDGLDDVVSVYYRMARYPEAISDFTRAMEIDPNDHLAYKNRALAYKKMGKVEMAEADLTKMRELQPE